MQKSALFKYFPPPRFLNPLRIGLSFSDLSIKAVTFGSGSSMFPIKNMRIPLEHGIVVGGIIMKPEELTKKLVEVKDKLGLSYASFTIPDELTYIFTANVPVVLGKDATESIGFMIEENVPLTLEDTIFDFVPVGMSSGGSGNEACMVVAACVKKEVEKSTEVLKAAGLEPLGCIPESQAIALAVVPKGFSNAACVAHVREGRIGIYLVRAGIVNFATLRSVVGENYGQEFSDEYAKFKEYFGKYDKSSDHSIGNLFVCGEFEYAKQIVEVVTGSTVHQEKATLADVWSNIFSIGEYNPHLPYEESLSFAGAIGSARSNS